MSATSPLQPTLWRTCRTIANRIRLEMFALLLDRPGQTVSTVAARLRQPLSLSSEYLRALEARGMLRSRRVGRWVEYRLSPATGTDPAAGLVSALRWAFENEPQPVETIFRLATAFSHPRRIEIFHALQDGPRTLGQIQAATRIPAWALRRHLRKLEARDFVTCHSGLYAAAKRPDGLGRELARLAAE